MVRTTFSLFAPLNTITRVTLCARAALVVTLLVSPAAHAFKVFACEPEWASLARALMPNAEVFSATHARQDPHHVEARPALIAQLRQADLAVCAGAGLESAWLPRLQARANNARVQDGQPGMFYAADHVRRIGHHQGLPSPFSGDVHAEGNPHVHTDPHRLLTVALVLRDRMILLAPTQQDALRRQHAIFDKRLREHIREWEQRLAPLANTAVVVHHGSFAYLFEWLRWRVVADLEPRPGMPPTPAHLQQLRDQMQRTPTRRIVVGWHQDVRPAQWLARQNSSQAITLLHLPATVPQDDGEALFRWMNGLVDALTKETVPP